ncbi:MAG: phosphatase PAP2 family protein [Planctomycetales bacterium]
MLLARSRHIAAATLLTISLTVAGFPQALESANKAPPRRPAGDPPGRDSILDWNAIALAAVVADHSGTFGNKEQGGPTRAARALAMVHLAMYDAANAVTPIGRPYFEVGNSAGASLDAAVATAARDTLSDLYPNQSAAFAQAHQLYLQPIQGAEIIRKEVDAGGKAARKMLQERRRDGSQVAGSYVPSGAPGAHDVDPLHPTQGFLTPAWGGVTPFGLSRQFQFRPNPPPALGSAAYAAALNDVKDLGGDGVTTPTFRTEEETMIGLYWAYDGTPGLGVPPRLYNQIVRTIALDQGNSELENARLFALVNAAQADAGIVCWGIKYHYVVWRPILGIRRADEDGNPHTDPDPDWEPLGAPASNQSGDNFTPPFPAYTSGHATFGAAVFQVLARFYGTDAVPFTFVSDELNGVTTDAQGNVRPYLPRSFGSLSDAAAENARSRIYLGIHWQFDADEGVGCGAAVGDAVFDTILRTGR